MKPSQNLALFMTAVAAKKSSVDYNRQWVTPDLSMRYSGNISETLETPNSTVSLPFSLGDGAKKAWTFRVNLTSATIPVEGDDKDSKVVLTSYDLHWPGSQDFGSAIESSTTEKRICASTFGIRFNSKITDGWDEGSVDCESAIGSGCLNALKNGIPNLEKDNNGCPSLDMAEPRFCGDKVFGGEGFGLHVLTTDITQNPSNLTNGAAFAYVASPPVQPADDKFYETESTRLHMVILTTNATVTPLCARLDSKHIKGSDLGAANSAGRVGRASYASCLGVAVGLGALAWLV